VNTVSESIREQVQTCIDTSHIIDCTRTNTFNACAKYTHFQILVISHANAGKTTLLEVSLQYDQGSSQYHRGSLHLQRKKEVAVFPAEGEIHNQIHSQIHGHSA
jgi:hypothetical protein